MSLFLLLCASKQTDRYFQGSIFKRWSCSSAAYYTSFQNTGIPGLLYMFLHKQQSTCYVKGHSPPPQPSGLKLHLCRKLLSKVQQKLLSQRKEPGAPVFCLKEKVFQTFMHFLRNAPLHFQKDRMMSAGSREMSYCIWPFQKSNWKQDSCSVNICAE